MTGKNRRAEAGEPSQMSSDLGGRDLPRIVAHHTEAVVQCHVGAVDASEPLQGESRGRGTAPARHLGNVQPDFGRVRSLDGDGREQQRDLQ